MYIVGNAVQGDNLGKDFVMASPEVQSQYFEWECPAADADSEIASVQYPLVQGRLRKNVDFWLKELEPSSFVSCRNCFCGLPFALHEAARP